VVVAVNQGGSSVNLTFTYQNGTVTSVTKYTTSGSKNANNDGSINVTGGSFSTTLDAQSITSFVQN
jgi:glucuronoarabinoxylan endo-1,4-beta-xylanase